MSTFLTSPMSWAISLRVFKPCSIAINPSSCSIVQSKHCTPKMNRTDSEDDIGRDSSLYSGENDYFSLLLAEAMRRSQTTSTNPSIEFNTACLVDSYNLLFPTSLKLLLKTLRLNGMIFDALPKNVLCHMRNEIASLDQFHNHN